MRKIRLIPKGFFSTSTGPQFHIFYTIMAAVTSCEKALSGAYKYNPQYNVLWHPDLV